MENSTFDQMIFNTLKQYFGPRVAWIISILIYNAMLFAILYFGFQDYEGFKYVGW